MATFFTSPLRKVCTLLACLVATSEKQRRLVLVVTHALKNLFLEKKKPTVHAAVPANTFAIYGAGQMKELTELVPGILNQLGPDSLASLRKLAESYQAIQQGQQKPPNTAAEDDDDDDVPNLVESFDVEADAKDKLEELN
jgi:hypothetical protein